MQGPRRRPLRAGVVSRPVWPGTSFTPFQPQPVSPAASATPHAQEEGLALPSETTPPTGTSTETQPPSPTETSAPTLSPTAPPTGTPAPTEAPVAASSSPVPGPAVWLDPALPAGLREGLALPAGMALEEAPEGAALRLEVGPAPGATEASRWVYALAAPFPSQVKGVSLDELQRAWHGEPAGPFGGQPLLLDESTLAVWSTRWGPPAGGAVAVWPTADLVYKAWAVPGSWALLPFEALEARWKVLELDGRSPLRKGFDSENYPLTARFSLSGADPNRAAFAGLVPATNRDPARLTTLAMTGVTALVRATAFSMERQGIHYPGKDVGDVLREADLTHISNEVPFAANCPFPDPVQQGMRFCSDQRYIGLLEDVGADVVELTGDHFQDWGEAAMLFTLDLYRERGWGYYGGGADLADGQKPLLVEHNGNRLAFIGCNGKRGSFAQAGLNHPGAVPCDYDWMAKEVTRLRAEGYLPIATFQHFEYYTYRAQPDQVRDFRRIAEAGALIVSGSQAHQPQGMEFYNGAFIHYGLGNLFFDQYEVSLACRQAFIDRHVFYGGRYLGVELLPILFIDYARPRPMTLGEEADLLESVFRASGW